MPVAIRLSRRGTKGKPFYRMVILDSRKKRDGAFLENIGTYNGLTGELVTFKPERFEAWVAQGAQPSATAKKLYRHYKKHQKSADTASTGAEKKVATKATKAKGTKAAQQAQPTADTTAKT